MGSRQNYSLGRAKLSFEVTFPLLIETLLFSQRFSTEGSLAQGPSLGEHYPASTVLCPLRLPGSHFGSLAVTLVGQYFHIVGFHIVIVGFHIVIVGFHIVEELPGSPTFTYLLWLCAMLYDPGGVMHSCPSWECTILFSGNSTPSTTPKGTELTGLNHFSQMAYGPQLPCLRLTHAVTSASSRLGIECVGSALFQSHFQRPADRRFVAHRVFQLRAKLAK